MSERVLTLRRLNRALLARQLLLERRRLPVQRAVERLGALQAQYSPSPYVALWSRLADFRREQLTRALERGTVVHAGVVRSTLHVMAREDFPDFVSAYVDGQRGRAERRGADLEALSTALPDGPVSVQEVRRLAREALGVDDEWTIAFALRCIPHVLLPPSGTWRFHGTRTIVRWQERLPPPDEAAARVVRRCVAAFGPMSRRDVEHFTVLRLGRIDPGLAGLRRFEAEDGRVLFDVPRGPLPPEDAPAPVRFLPPYDSAILAHHDRTRILPAAYHETVIRKKNATTLATFLVDGFVAGSWRVERARSRATLVLSPFEPIPRSPRVDLANEAEQLVRFYEPDAPAFATRFA
ncbi:MAG: winged helix DNA-binding domain-containing protein [Actinobacteria bacterium]|nr:winged helix DNA-binding domain-containing protein [Actinomycetota bacterium]